MEDSAFSDAFCTFLQTTVPTVSAAELMLALLKQPERWWEPREAVLSQPGGADMSEPEARKYLDLFAARGVAATDEGGRFRYGPASADIDALVVTLAQAYNERPVTLIRIIYALRDSKIRSFADAFRFRKD